MKTTVICTTLVMFGVGSAWAGINEWTSIGPDGGSIQALAIDPQNPGTVYASTQLNVYRSTDGAASWAKTGFTGHANSLVIDPRNSDTIYAPTPTGVSKSTDGGASWSAASSGLPGAPILLLIIDPRNRTGLFKNIDGGASWKQLSPGLPERTYFGSLAIDPQDSSTVYLGTERGVFRSTDGGENWSTVNSGLPGISVSSLAIDPQDPNSVYAGTEAGLFVISFVP